MIPLATPSTPSTGAAPSHRTVRRVERTARVLPFVGGALDILFHPITEALVVSAVCFMLGFSWAAAS